MRLSRLEKRLVNRQVHHQEVLDRVYQRARREARDQSQLDLSTFPEPCPWPIEHILEDGWLPESEA
ncbi:hypothetical protein NKDENANG_02240 [Candidatus Entotheonellaceae bacterium PAL068K]